MDLQTQKLNLIEWLAGIEDKRVIDQFIELQKNSSGIIDPKLSESERTAIAKGLESIEEGRVHSHESVMQRTKDKYPNLFK